MFSYTTCSENPTFAPDHEKHKILSCPIVASVQLQQLFFYFRILCAVRTLLSFSFFIPCPEYSSHCNRLKRSLLRGMTWLLSKHSVEEFVWSSGDIISLVHFLRESQKAYTERIKQLIIFEYRRFDFILYKQFSFTYTCLHFLSVGYIV